jgi:glycosyltransferase involved in cell wall biosynthesis
MNVHRPRPAPARGPDPQEQHPMKILIAHSRYRAGAPSGENRVVDSEAAALAAAGQDVTLFQRHSDEIAGWPLTRKAALPALSVYNPAVRRELTDLLGRERPDVVHVHNTFPMLSASVLEACRDAAVPVVATMHNYRLACASGDFFRDGQPCHACADGSVGAALRHGCYRGSRAATVPVATALLASRRSWRELVSAYVFISVSQRDLLAGVGLPSERVFVKDNFVASPPVPAAGTTESRGHLVSSLGRLDAAKGVPLLMAAWDHFRRANPRSPLRLAIAGDGPLMGRVRDWATGHGSVDVLGHLSRPEATALIARSLAVVVPSAWEETFGLVAVEAMAGGVAPIVPDRGSFPDLVTDGVDGALFRPGEARDLAGLLADVDRAPERFVALGTRGRRTHAARFGQHTNIERLLGIYRYAIEHPAVGTPAPALASGARP